MKQKPGKILVVAVFLTLLSLVSYPVTAEDTEYAWILQDVLQTTRATSSIDPDQPFPADIYEHTDHYTWRVELYETWADIRRTAPGGGGNHPMDIHVVYRWTPPPAVIRPGDTVVLPVDIEVINAETGGFGVTFGLNARLGQQWPMSISTPSRWEGLEYVTVGAPFSSGTRSRATHIEESTNIVLEREAWREIHARNSQRLQLNLPENTMVGWVYEWAPVPEERTGYTAWQPEGAESEHSERFLSFFAEVEALVRLGEEFRAASPDYLEDFNELLEEYRPE